MWTQPSRCDADKQIELLSNYYYSINQRNNSQKPHFLIGAPDLLYQNYSMNMMSYFDNVYRATGMNIPFFIYSEFLSLPSTNHYAWSMIGSSKNSLSNILKTFKTISIIIYTKFLFFIF